MLSYHQKHKDRGCQGVHIRHNGAPCHEYPIRIWRTGRQRNTWHEAEDHRHPVLFHLLVVPLQPGLFFFTEVWPSLHIQNSTKMKTVPFPRQKTPLNMYFCLEGEDKGMNRI